MQTTLFRVYRGLHRAAQLGGACQTVASDGNDPFKAAVEPSLQRVVRV